MAGDKGQRTEQPTPRRLEKARQEGQFLSSRELVSAAQFAAFVAVLSAWGGRGLDRMSRVAATVFGRAFDGELGEAATVELIQRVLWHTVWPLAVAGGILVIASLAVQLALTRMGFSLKRLAPNLRRLNPVSKLRDLFRQNLWSLVKAVVILPLLGAAVYAVVAGNLQEYLGLPRAGTAAGLHWVAASVLDLLWKSTGVFVALGAVDLVQQWRRHQQDLRMSRHEVREEAKEMEGNPQVKSQIRRLRRDLLRRQMMRQVKTATAVVVNPTHYAVAIRYRVESMTAPVVVAKGRNYLAQRIRALAVENQVPLIENPPLAQSLYKNVEVGQEIPTHLYRAVAEVLAYIHRLMNGRLPG